MFDFQFGFIANLMPQKTALPNGGFLASPFRFVHPIVALEIRVTLFCDESFYHCPAYTEVCVIRRQRPDAMEMVRQ
jgi:hypothetical protein